MDNNATPSEPPHSSTSSSTSSSPSSTEPTLISSENPITKAVQSEDESALPPPLQSSITSVEKVPRNKKRKRTSPEDHNILEQEYKRNPKPDKAARLAIVENVSLSEKEVRVWFQNQRSGSRRKSRPLLPHEIVAFGLGGMAALLSDPISNSSYGGSQPMSPEAHLCSDVSSGQPQSGSQEKESSVLQTEEKLLKLEEVTTPTFEMEHIPCQPPQPLNDISGAGRPLHADEQKPNVIREASEALVDTQLSKHHLESSFSAPSLAQAPIINMPSSNPHPESPLVYSKNDIPGKRNAPSSARMRLSLSLDGRAELAKVSPHRSHVPRPSSFNLSAAPRRAHGLQRSQSALPLGLGSNKLMAAMRPPRLPTGSSRDARAWEFYADNGTRKERSLPIECHDSSGSAVAAISLIRSAGNSALKLNQNKRNATSAKSGDGKAVKRPKLSRASSSLARLQGSHKNGPLKSHGSKQSLNLAESPTGDSDKENWMLGENGSNVGTTGATTQWPKQDRRRVLEPTVNMPGFPSKAGARRNKNKISHDESKRIFEDEVGDENVDPEVERFMKGDISPSKKGDLDCVQGLLSLSQGNWR